jgi:DNA-directed RNA polymerase
MAFCFDWKNFMSAGLGYKSQLPCHMDASNNGLQLLGILMRDEISCHATNVSPTNYPQDIYQIVADKTIEFLKQDNNDYADDWIKFGITRSAVKRPCMTQAYGSTPYACRKYISDWYDDECKNKSEIPFNDTNKFQATNYLSRKVWDAIHAVVGKPQDAMAWLQDTAVRLAEADKPFYWVSPSGFPCYQHYTKWANKAIKTKIGDKVMRVRFRDDTDILSKRRQFNGSSPNFIHSIDSAILHKTVNLCGERFGMNSFAMVHDSYGCHTTKCDAMASVIREVFVDVFTPDLMQQLKDSVEEREGVDLAPLPTKGTFEVSNIIKSEYIFA